MSLKVLTVMEVQMCVFVCGVNPAVNTQIHRNTSADCWRKQRQKSALIFCICCVTNEQNMWRTCGTCGTLEARRPGSDPAVFSISVHEFGAKSRPSPVYLHKPVFPGLESNLCIHVQPAC